MIKEEALYQFWSSFGWKAFKDITTIDPDTGRNPEFPYITYDVVTGNMGEKCYMNATLWDRSTSTKRLTEKKYEITRRFKTMENPIPIDGGYMSLWLENPQSEGHDPEDSGVLTIEIPYTAEFHTEF